MPEQRPKDPDNFAVHRPRYKKLEPNEPRGKYLPFPTEERRRKTARERLMARPRPEPADVNLWPGILKSFLIWTAVIVTIVSLIRIAL